MNRELIELKNISDQLYAEWAQTRSQDVMSRWLEINDAIMAIVRKELGV
jgi:hypothetical protein